MTSDGIGSKIVFSIFESSMSIFFILSSIFGICLSLRTFLAMASNDANISSPEFQKSVYDLLSKYNLCFCNAIKLDAIWLKCSIIYLPNILPNVSLKLKISLVKSIRICLPSSRFIDCFFLSDVQLDLYLAIRSQNRLDIISTDFFLAISLGPLETSTSGILCIFIILDARCVL